jgi:hypothetical protein
MMSPPERSCPGDHDLADVLARLEMAISILGLRKRKDPIDHGAQSVLCDDAIHGFERGATPDRRPADRHEPAAQHAPVERGPVPEGPDEAISLLKAAALIDRASVVAPIVSTTWSTPRFSVSSRTAWSQSDEAV